MQGEAVPDKKEVTVVHSLVFTDNNNKTALIWRKIHLRITDNVYVLNALVKREVFKDFLKESNEVILLM